MQMTFPAAYVREEEARGLVSSVFRDVRARMPFVPAVFKSLARDPPALVDAWLQARILLDDPEARRAAHRYADLADPKLAYRPAPDVRAAVAPFTAELPAMLLVVSSLRLSLDGVLPLRPRPELGLPDPGPLPATPVPEDRGENPRFDEIRRVYGTRHVPSMFRALAAAGLLEDPWQAVGPFLASGRGRALVHRVAAAATQDARRFPGAAVFRVESARPTLDQFAAALPRNLVFALAASSGAIR